MSSKPMPSKVITTVFLAFVLTACASESGNEISPTVPLVSAMEQLGQVRQSVKAPDAKGQVVVIKDRHSTRPGFHRVRRQLRQVQKDNRHLIQYLVRRGFRILGCEQTLGEILPNATTESQYKLIAGRMKHGIDLDEYSVFQPIRFQLLWGANLSVWGVEDPALFAKDISDFRAFAKARQNVRRNDLTEADRAGLRSVLVASQQKLRLNIKARGEKAAENLLSIMQEQGVSHGILLVGGAHVPAALRVLEQTGYDIYVFASSRYAPEKNTAAPEDD